MDPKEKSFLSSVMESKKYSLSVVRPTFTKHCAIYKHSIFIHIYMYGKLKSTNLKLFMYWKNCTSFCIRRWNICIVSQWRRTPWNFCCTFVSRGQTRETDQPQCTVGRFTVPPQKDFLLQSLLEWLSFHITIPLISKCGLCNYIQRVNAKLVLDLRDQSHTLFPTLTILAKSSIQTYYMSTYNQIKPSLFISHQSI